MIFSNNKIGSRLKTSLDFGHVQLTIQGVRPQDSGIYTCKATNKLGEAVSTTSIKVDGKRLLSLFPTNLQKASETALLTKKSSRDSSETNH